MMLFYSGILASSSEEDKHGPSQSSVPRPPVS